MTGVTCGLTQGVTHTLLRGVNTPNFRTTPPRLQGKRRERGEGEGGEREGERRREGKGPPRVG